MTFEAPVITIGIVLTAAVLLFGNGLVRPIWNALRSRYRWEGRPVHHTNDGLVTARLSHGHTSDRQISLAYVGVPQSPIKVALGRWLGGRADYRTCYSVAQITGDEPLVLKPHRAADLSAQVPETIQLPRWRFRKPLRNVASRDARLFLYVKVDRRWGYLSRRVRRSESRMRQPGTGA